MTVSYKIIKMNKYGDLFEENKTALVVDENEPIVAEKVEDEETSKKDAVVEETPELDEKQLKKFSKDDLESYASKFSIDLDKRKSKNNMIKDFLKTKKGE